MTEPPRPDLSKLRRQLKTLITVIAITVISLVVLTLYLYSRFTAGVTVAP